MTEPALDRRQEEGREEEVVGEVEDVGEEVELRQDVPPLGVREEDEGDEAVAEDDEGVGAKEEPQSDPDVEGTEYTIQGREALPRQPDHSHHLWYVHPM